MSKTPKRLGKLRYPTYEFPKLDVIKKWSTYLLKRSKKEFTSFENKFILTTGQSLEHGIELTEEQVWTLEILYAKYTE